MVKMEENEKPKELIKITNLSFGYKDPIIRDVNLSIYEKDFLGIVGPNGGGKTTLIKLILGLLEPDKGSIRIMGKPPKEGRDAIGYVSQFNDIDFDYPITVREVVLLSRIRSLFYHFNRDDFRAVDDMLKRMDIYGLKDKKLNELSGGEKQRVFIARAIANSPRILILDEPVANVDIHLKEEFYKLLEDLNKELAIIIVDHDLDTLSKHAKEIACVDKCQHHGVKYHTKYDNLIKVNSCDV